MSKPKLRFPEFSDDWVQHILSDIIVDIADGPFGSNLKLEHYTDKKEARIIQLSNLSDYGWQEENTRYTTFEHAETIKRCIVNEDELIMGKMMPAGMTIMRPTTDKMYVLSSDCVRIKLDKSAATNEFFLYTTKSEEFLNQIRSSSQGSTRIRTSISKIKNMNLNIPSLPEQQKIASLFSELDNLIQSAQKELEGYRELKQGMLQKMFPKKGETTPEIRFPEFTGDWEHRKFGEVLETVTDYVAAGSFADLAKNVEYKDYPDYAQLIRTMDLKNGFTSTQEVYVNKNAFDYLHRVNMDKECIILPNIGNCGEVYYVKPENLPYKHNVLGPNAIFVRSETCANNFLSILFQAKDFQTKLKLIVSPNGQTKFNKTELKGIDLILPSNVYEQEKIGQYFENLDNLITLQQKEIDGYKELKKGLLQQMFC